MVSVDKRKATLYTEIVIKSFRHKGLERFFATGSARGIQPHHAARLRRQLTQLNVVERPDEMNVPGWRLHRLHGELKDFWAVEVSGNWRLIFRFSGTDAEQVDYVDYH